MSVSLVKAPTFPVGSRVAIAPSTHTFPATRVTGTVTGVHRDGLANVTTGDGWAFRVNPSRLAWDLVK